MTLSKTLLLVPLGFALVAPAFAHDSDEYRYRFGDSRPSSYGAYRRAEAGHRYYHRRARRVYDYYHQFRLTPRQHRRLHRDLNRNHREFHSNRTFRSRRDYRWRY